VVVRLPAEELGKLIFPLSENGLNFAGPFLYRSVGLNVTSFVDTYWPLKMPLRFCLASWWSASTWRTSFFVIEL
jgi:hypothetical protein